MQLKLENLSKQYNKGEAYALDKVNLDIKEGEFISVLGLSGSGKSTLIRCINRLIDPTDGNIYFEEKEITKLKGEDLRLYRRKIAMIFQQYNLIPRMDVITNVLAGRFGYFSANKIIFKKFKSNEIMEAEAALEKVGLINFTNRQVKTLSGGQQQRVGIARALLQQPKMLLGDEPVSSLDPVTAEEVMKLLWDINKNQGITMVMNLHTVELARAYSKRIIGINKGKIVFDGSPKDLYEIDIKEIYR
ncbi:phosphonate ABC transporter ATP-binding protein [Alkaliphilus peptidifermentans]|uniref:Phosphonate transport system ATP-binding protein n=1 Tax=Alkaliphilus peptidifermentans DSM 18978 TaxID=1120976 RepID=A0A1G5GL31_9FIRM|nr:phosphonate ABC transporter ATP-binding protein [Alkaliphilus peptidifermentans]SCY52296.1 phosphonate transport system ATP-binding protein [Alkaliphilus peptidifermentans DSM 18978]